MTDRSTRTPWTRRCGLPTRTVTVDDLPADLMARYVAADGEHPKLDRLGGSTWEKTKKAVRKSVKVLAKDVLKLSPCTWG